MRSLAVSPRLMLMDEVTSALDPVLVNEVLSTVRELKAEGMTMVIATHEMGFAEQVADEVCFLSAGTIVERGTPGRCCTTPRTSGPGTSCAGCTRPVGCSRPAGQAPWSWPGGRPAPRARLWPRAAATR